MNAGDKERAMAELRANLAREQPRSSNKRVRLYTPSSSSSSSADNNNNNNNNTVMVTPTLEPATMSNKNSTTTTIMPHDKHDDDDEDDDEEQVMLPEPLVARGRLERVHSLALSDFGSTDADLEFVNPFEQEVVVDGGGGGVVVVVDRDDDDDDDDDIENNLQTFFPPTPRPGVLRETSVATSSSDMGGYGALLNNNKADAVEMTKTSFGNLSTRYDDDDDKDVENYPLLAWHDDPNVVPFEELWDDRTA